MPVADETWAIVGCTGFTGSAICENLARSGVKFKSISAPRLELDTRATVPEVHARASATPLDAIVKQIRGCEVVVNAAGLAAPDARATSDLFGANALLPSVLALAAHTAGAARFVHISSAAVQGYRRTLSGDAEGAPFSPYSESKFLGERALLSLDALDDLTVRVFRATSVQGSGRATTQSLASFARSRLASVAGDGSRPSVIATREEFAASVVGLANENRPLPRIVVQPWAGRTVRDVLLEYGGREPLRLPDLFCRAVITSARQLARLTRRPWLAAHARRLEMLWFGQAIKAPERC